MAARITDFEILDHGIEHSQYFQGCGVAFTNYANVATGVGANFAEAYEDCCEQMATSGAWHPETKTWMSFDLSGWSAFDKRVLKEIGRRTFPKRPAITRQHNEECYYHVSIRYNVEAIDPDDSVEHAERFDGMA